MSTPGSEPRAATPAQAIPATPATAPGTAAKAASAVSASDSRNRAVDGLRVVSIAGVLLIHVSAWGLQYPHDVWPTLVGSIARSAVPAFLLVSGYFWARRPRTGADIRRSVLQLLVPYAIWSAIYLAVEIPTGLRHVPSLAGASLLLLTGTTAWQLWFLPALFVCRVVGMWATDTRWRAILVLIGAPAFILAATATNLSPVADVVLHESVVGWMSVFFLGMLLAGVRSAKLQPGVVWAVVAACLAVMALKGTVPEFGMWGALGFAAARVVLPAVLLVDATHGGDALGLSRLAIFAPLAFGVYLVHMLPVDALRLLGPGWLPVSAGQMAGGWLFVGTVSLAISWLLGRSRPGRAVLGESCAG